MEEQGILIGLIVSKDDELKIGLNIIDMGVVALTLNHAALIANQLDLILDTVHYYDEPEEDDSHGHNLH